MSAGEAPAPSKPKSGKKGIPVDPGKLDAWIIGLEKRLFVNNEQAARDLGVLEIINRFGIAEIKEKLKAPRGLIFFEEPTDA